MFEEPIIPLADDMFRLLRDLIHDYCGIYFDDGSKFLLERRLSRRLSQHRLKTFEEYYQFLRYDRKPTPSKMKIFATMRRTLALLARLRKVLAA